jgi:hypothetical protein
MDWLTGASRGDVKEATMQVVDELRKINKTLESGIEHNPQPHVVGGEEACKRLEDMCRPLVEYINRECDPYTEIRVTCDGAFQTSTVLGVPNMNRGRLIGDQPPQCIITQDCIDALCPALTMQSQATEKQ